MNRGFRISKVAHGRLAQKGDCFELESEVPGSIFTGGNILLLKFLFSHCKASDANIGNIANVV